MLEIEDVRFAYRLILGREPENEAVLRYHANQVHSLAELRQNFLCSTEFQNNMPVVSPFRPLTWPPIDVEVEATEVELFTMMRHQEEVWARIGLLEPHWSVCTAEAFRATNISQTEIAFFESGHDGLERLQRTAERCNVDLSRLTRCFELGCGVGRMTIWLAGLFDQIVSADISDPHLTIARQALKRFERSNVELLHLNSFGALDYLNEFDVLVSIIVLQHNPPPLIAYLLKKLLSKLRPGGVAYFQVPTYSPQYRFRIREYLDSASARDSMEMHLIPQPALFNIIQEARCRVLEIREDAWTGDRDTISNSVFLVKQESTEAKRNASHSLHTVAR